jgi:hypothetical protein
LDNDFKKYKIGGKCNTNGEDEMFTNFCQGISREVKTYVKVRGKEIPLQGWTDPKGSRRLRLPDFKTIGT